MNTFILTLLIILTLFLLLGIGFIIYCLYVLVIKSKKSQPVMIPVLNFEQDILFLNYIIESKINDAKNFNLLPLRYSRSTFTREEDLAEIQDRTIIDIYNYLSPSYKKTLNKYLTDDAIIVYISEKVFKELTLSTIENNIKSIKK